jgi:hypothetical protein
MEEGNIHLNYITDLENKLKDANLINDKLNIKLATVQNNYERMDILYDKIYTLLSEEQKKQLDQFISDSYR